MLGARNSVSNVGTEPLRVRVVRVCSSSRTAFSAFHLAHSPQISFLPLSPPSPIALNWHHRHPITFSSFHSLCLASFFLSSPRVSVFVSLEPPPPSPPPPPHPLPPSRGGLSTLLRFLFVSLFASLRGASGISTDSFVHPVFIGSRMADPFGKMVFSPPKTSHQTHQTIQSHPPLSSICLHFPSHASVAFSHPLP